MIKSSSYKIKITALTPLLLILMHNVMGQEQQFLQRDIAIFFNEIKKATKRNDNLWNENLYGPILLVDPNTRQVFSNEPDTAGILTRNGDIFSGILPANINIANTSINFSGKRWAMVMLPLPENEKDRINLLAHELFHTIQPALGFALYNPENNHLDQKEGRVYLRLELEALKKGLQSVSKNELQQHLTNALTFRKYRHLIYPEADSTENLLEINEGIAEFNGVIISGRNKKQAIQHFVNDISAFLVNPTFVRSFAYQTIPAYGYLQVDRNKNWNKEITAKTNLTSYFIKAFDIIIPNDLKVAVENLADGYNGKAILREETARAEKTKKLIAEYKVRFIEQPHFEILFEKMNVSFDPRNMIPVEDMGTVYPKIRVTDLWGILTVENGALMSAGWDKIFLTIPIKTIEKTITGDGWPLELRDGYVLEKDEMSRNYKLIKK